MSAALGGRVVFRSRYAHGAFHSSIATPVSDGGVLLGALLLQEEDEAHADSIRAVQKHLGILSLVIAAATLLSGSLFVQRMTSRLRSLIASMRTVAKGDYHFRHVSRGRDEISRLGTEFNALTERLESNEEERRRFVADASHELKTPLAAIRLLSDSILHNRGIAADTAREFVADIAEETKRLQKTTEKLLLLSRLDGREEAAPVALELAAAARDVLDSLHAFAREKNVTLRTELEPGCVVLAPRESVEHILYNLVDNAVKYNVPDGSVLVSLRAEGSEAVLTVADTGIGIPEKERAKIFDRFYRVDKARSREGGGSGLGLSIVHDAVLALGGDVRVEPNTPRGTRFIVRLPRLSQERTT